MEVSSYPNKMSLRTCIATIRQIIELSDDKRGFRGLFAPKLDFLVDNVWRFFPNASFVSSNKLGDMDPKTMMFDGCLGRLQRNESDTALPCVTLPLLRKGLMHATTGSASKVVMWSVYNNTVVPSDTDVMDAFDSFTAQLWLLIFLTTAFLTLVLFLIFYSDLLSLPESKARRDLFRRLTKMTKRHRMRRCMDQALLIVTANVLKQHTSYSFRGKLLRRRMILFLIAVFSFLVINYFSSMIKTEMVVQKRPETISSYEELLAKPNVKPLWPKSLNIHWAFMNADRNSAEGRIWERTKKFGVDSCFLKSGGHIKRYMGSISRQEAVWFHPINSMGVMVMKTCALHRASGLYTDVNMWYRSDENARENLEVVMLSAALHPVSVKKLNRIIRAEFEHHLQHKALERIEFSVFPHTGIKSVRDCAANSIIYPDYQMETVHLSHFNRLMLLSGYFLLFCFLVLSSEIMWNMFRRIASKKTCETWRNDTWSNYAKQSYEALFI